MFSKKELGFILYNNRSVSGVVANFLPKIDPYELIELEKKLDQSKSKFETPNKMVEVSISDLDLNTEDIIVKPIELEKLKEIIIQNVGKFNDDELSFLNKRNMNIEITNKWNILGLSNFKNKKDLITIGATGHPILSKIIDDGIDNGGIVIPLFEYGILTNCAIRKINCHKSLKYSLACPDISVWGLEDIKEGDEIWITEGIFDMIALREIGEKAVSCSSAMWSGIQLHRVITKKPKFIKIFADSDSVGLKTAAILRDFFKSFSIESIIFKSDISKDAAEHFFEKKCELDDLIETDVTVDLINEYNDESYNFIKHLKNRKF